MALKRKREEQLLGSEAVSSIADDGQDDVQEVKNDPKETDCDGVRKNENDNGKGLEEARLKASPKGTVRDGADGNDNGDGEGEDDARLKDPTLYTHHRRRAERPPRGSQGKQRYMVTRQTRLPQVERIVNRALDGVERRAEIVASGAAIQRCCEVALAVQRARHNDVDVRVQTDSQTFVDEYHPVKEGLNAVSKECGVSCIRITLTLRDVVSDARTAQAKKRHRRQHRKQVGKSN